MTDCNVVALIRDILTVSRHPQLIKDFRTMNPIEQLQLMINEALGGFIHQASSTSSNLALTLGLF